MILVTGAAGFIGYHLCKKLLSLNEMVVGMDNLNNYYDVSLKKDRLNDLSSNANFIFFQYDINDFESLSSIFEKYSFDFVIHLAAQAGVRNSFINPDIYVKTNINGFYNVLKCVATKKSIKRFIFASSSSVYGSNSKIPFSEEDKVEKQASLYAATKKCDETLAKVFADLYDIKVVGLRFFTVYGPFGRPDMAYFKFADAMTNNNPIELNNNGNMLRDFTYIDDIVNGIIKSLEFKMVKKFELFNLGNNNPVQLLEFVDIIKRNMCPNKKINVIGKPTPKGDIEITYASIKKAKKRLSWEPTIDINTGLKYFCDWYKSYFKINKD